MFYVYRYLSILRNLKVKDWNFQDWKHYFIIFWYFNLKMYQIFQIQSLLWTLRVPAWNKIFWKKLLKVLSFYKIWTLIHFLSFPFLEHLPISFPWLKIYPKCLKSVLFILLNHHIIYFPEFCSLLKIVHKLLMTVSFAIIPSNGGWYSWTYVHIKHYIWGIKVAELFC